MNIAVSRPARTATLRLDAIQIPENARPLDPNAVEDLARSIASLGLQCAPTCVARGDEYHLVAGRHRLEALRKLGVKSILVRVVDFDDIEARMWAIAENLHRAELTTEQRYEQIAEYTRLTKEKRQEEDRLPAARSLSCPMGVRLGLSMMSAAMPLPLAISAYLAGKSSERRTMPHSRKR